MRPIVFLRCQLFDPSSDLKALTFAQSPGWWKRPCAWEIFPLMANLDPKPHIWAFSTLRPVVYGQTVIFKFEACSPVLAGVVQIAPFPERTPKCDIRGEGPKMRLIFLRSEGCCGESARSARPLTVSKPGRDRSEREVRSRVPRSSRSWPAPAFPAGVQVGTTEIPLYRAHP